MFINENWYEVAKTYDLKAYLENKYALVFRGNKTNCPLHGDDKKPSFSVKNNLFKCFTCDAGGSIVDFVMKKDGITSSLDAVKRVLLDHGVDVGNDKELTKEEQDKRNRIIAENTEKNEKRRKEQEEREQKNREYASRNMNLIAHKYVADLQIALSNDHREVLEAIEKVFPKYFNVSNLNSIGWDWDNETVVLITRDKAGNVTNIKRRTIRQNFTDWDVNKPLFKWNNQGKWIGWKDSTSFPFGVSFLNQDDRVIVCEGEKDAFNLICLGVNALTLGGVANRWEQFLGFLKNKRVYIWFDHDKAGYVNALNRHAEIKTVSKSCQIVLFSKLEQELENKFDVSDYLELYKFAGADEVFEKITYSAFVPHNELLIEIDELYNDWGEQPRPIDFLLPVKQVVFKDIKNSILENAQYVRGEKDNKLKAMVKLSEKLSESENNKNLEKLITTLFNGEEKAIQDEVETLKKILKINKPILSAYRQVHIYDIVQEALRTIKASGYMFAKYRGSLYLWTGAYYYRFNIHSKDDSEISDFILQSFFPKIYLDKKKRTVETSIKVVQNIKGYAQSLEDWIEPTKRILTMQNGALVIRASGKWLFKTDSNKRDCAFNVLDIHYDADATAPKWQKFLNRVLPDLKDQEALMEFVGYCLMPSHRFEKFLLLYGETGANGKSVVLDVIKGFFGAENISGLQLQNFMGHELDSLTGKILNVGSELDPKADLKQQVSVLKSLVSPGDTLTINPKFEKGYEMTPEEKPKIAFASNGIPKSGVDGGFFRRVLAFSFDQEIKDNEKIRDLVQRLTDEKAGILNLALEGLARLNRQGTFSVSEKRAIFMEQYRDDADPIRVYAKESLQKATGVMVAKNYIYAHYKAWCEDRGHRIAAQRTFFGKLSSHIAGYSEKRTTINKLDELLPSNCWYVENVRFKENSIEEFHFKKGVRKTEHCMISASGGYSVTFE